MYLFCLLFMKFIIFCIIGYICEMTMCTIVDGKVSNRGFLCGPVIPIYGVGSISLIYLLKPYVNYPLLVFLLGVIITSTIEYITSYYLEKIFHNKWWDYSKEKFNLDGRICLLNSFLFGIGALLILYFLNPFISNILIQIKNNYLVIGSTIILIIFILDIIYSIIVAYSLRNHIIIVEDLKNDKLAKIPGMLEQILNKKLLSKKGIKYFPNRLLNAFPNLNKKYFKEFEIIKKIRMKEKRNKHKKK